LALSQTLTLSLPRFHKASSSDTQPPRLKLVEITKRFGSFVAGQKQKVEILKQLYLHSKILILDEPTSVLTPVEADEVLGMLLRMVEAKQLSVHSHLLEVRNRDVAILLLSEDLDELVALSDRQISWTRQLLPECSHFN
jgi:ABC-type uncharacterized transport system ATPase subunit